MVEVVGGGSVRMGEYRADGFDLVEDWKKRKKQFVSHHRLRIIFGSNAT